MVEFVKVPAKDFIEGSYSEFGLKRKLNLSTQSQRVGIKSKRSNVTRGKKKRGKKK